MPLQASSRFTTRTPLRVFSLPGRNYRNNPYFGLFCDALENAGLKIVDINDRAAKRMQFDILHVHFPEHYVTERSLVRAILSSLTCLTFLGCTRLLKKQIVWTVHDTVPFKQNHFWLLWPYLSFVRRLVSGYVFMNTSSRVEFLDRYPAQKGKPYCEIPHGPYPAARLSQSRRQELRSQFGGHPGCIIVGFLGDIKPYKNIEALEKLPTHTGKGRAVRVLIAGRPDPLSYSSNVDVVLRRSGSSRIIRIDERLTDERLSELIQAVDAVFLPYKKGSNSGFAMLVLSCGGRIISSNLGMFRDLEFHLGKEWVRTVNLSASTDCIQLALGEISEGEPDPLDLARRDSFLNRSSFLNGGINLSRFYRELTTSGHATSHSKIASR